MVQVYRKTVKINDDGYNNDDKMVMRQTIEISLVLVIFF